MVKDDDILEIGTLVQVRDDALQPGAEYGSINRETVSNHGYLYLVYEDATKDRPYLYDCKSIATGETHSWFVSELNVVEELS